jgi:transcriptional regulator with XRE-family HTH domain
MAVADRIKKWRKVKGLSQGKLAEAVGVSRAAINQWEKNTPKLRDHHIMALARALGRPESTFTPFGGDTVTGPEGRKHSIPLLHWEDLKHLREGKVHTAALKKQSYVEVSKDISKRAVMLVVHDDSMEPEFRVGDEIIIDPEVLPRDSDQYPDFVLVRVGDGEEIFRRYVGRRGGAYDLVAENPEWETYSVNSRHPGEVLGTMVEHRKKRRTS